jgi:selenoprotein W-related protein
LAQSIQALTGQEPELIPSAGGVFEVICDGRLIFSKRKLGRFPEDEEVLAQLRE